MKTPKIVKPIATYVTESIGEATIQSPKNFMLGILGLLIIFALGLAVKELLHPSHFARQPSEAELQQLKSEHIWLNFYNEMMRLENEHK